VNPNVISTGILTGHWLIVIGLTVRVIMRRPPVGVSLGWLAVIFSVPFVGAFIYLLFGEKRLGRRRMRRIRASIGGLTDWQSVLKAQYPPVHSEVGLLGEPLLRQAETVTGFPASGANHLELLDRSEPTFDRIIADIDAAKSRIHLAFYIWQDGGRVTDIVDALVRAAERGVQCRALADALGSKAFLEGESARRLRAAGIELVAALPTGVLRTLFARADLRNHRKIVVIDDHIAYSGSQNLVDPRLFRRDLGVGEWIDAMLRLEGPAAAALDGVFRFDWAVETDTELESVPPTLAVGTAAGGSIVQVVPSGPDVRPEAIHWSLLTAIYAAREELVLSAPYFVPDESILTALITAALRGVAVTLIVPARNDSVLVRYASVAHYDELMAAGVRIARFEGGFLHTKSLTVDSDISLFGSVNLDVRSLWLNLEISLFVYDRDFSRQLRLLQESYLRDADWVDPAVWRRRPARSRFVANTCRLLGPVL
jgi:cardiolipin synthase